MVVLCLESGCYDPLCETKLLEEEEIEFGEVIWDISMARTHFEHVSYGVYTPAPAETPDLVYLSGSVQDMEIEDSLVVPDDDVVMNITPKSLL